MPDYDYIIAGAGAAGLSLAYHLMLSPLRERRILIIDKDDDDQLNRNWGFWTNQPTLFDRVVHHTWRQIDFVSTSFQRRYGLGDYEYKLMHGANFYNYAVSQLQACPNITFVRGVVQSVEDAEDTARVTVGENAHTGGIVFDSVVRFGGLKQQIAGHPWLRMHFKGWEIKTPTIAFDPRAARLFDFRTPQDGLMRFFYVMPYSECHAFVEYTVFSENVLKQHEYEAAIGAYLTKVLGIQEYDIVSEENGAVPRTDYPFQRRLGQHVMSIGAKGGRVKCSTGYSFLRIQRDSAAIVRSLLQAGHPFDVPADPAFNKWCDSLMLRLMRKEGQAIAPVFAALFRHNPIDRIFRFLDECSSPVETAALIASLPPRRFISPLLSVLSNRQARA